MKEFVHILLKRIHWKAMLIMCLGLNLCLVAASISTNFKVKDFVILNIILIFIILLSGIEIMKGDRREEQLKEKAFLEPLHYDFLLKEIGLSKSDIDKHFDSLDLYEKTSLIDNLDVLISENDKLKKIFSK